MLINLEKNQRVLEMDKDKSIICFWFSAIQQAKIVPKSVT